MYKMIATILGNFYERFLRNFLPARGKVAKKAASHMLQNVLLRKAKCS